MKPIEILDMESVAFGQRITNTGTSDIAQFKRISIPLIRRHHPAFLLNKLPIWPAPSTCLNLLVAKYGTD